MQAELRGAFPGPKLSIGPKGEQGAGELCLWGEEWPGDPAACGEAGAGEPLHKRLLLVSCSVSVVVIQ